MMKKLFFSLMLSAAALTASAQYQFPNSTFDDDFISSYGSYTEPEGWHGYATIDASSLNSAGRSGDKLQQFTSVRSGATGKCVGVHSTSILGVVANGVLTNGQIYTHSTTATDGKNNYNFSDPTNTGNSSTYGANNQFYTTFTGRPDYVNVWVKFAPAKSGTGCARMSVILHKAGTKMYDPEDNVTDNSIVVARAQTNEIAACDWTQLRIPFTYVSTSDPGLILATFTTNKTPGGGSENDYLYVDDIEMEYLSTLVTATYNGSNITFDANGDATIEAAYNQKMLKYTTGAGATVETSMSDDYKLTIKITGNNVSVDPTNVHTYTIQFTGIASGNDDESSVKVTTESIVGSAPSAGWFYILNKSTGKFMAASSSTSTTAHKWSISAESNATIKDANSKVIKLSASRYSDGSVSATGTSTDLGVNFTESNSYYQIWGYYEYLTATRYHYIYDSNGTLSVKQGSDNATGDEYKWMLIDAGLYDRVNGFWKSYTSASLTNKIDASDFITKTINNTVEKQTITTLPLGLYQIGTGSIFYLPNGNSLDIAANTTTLTYYGRLDFSLDATYDGTTLANGMSIDEIYDSSKLKVNLTGNGSETYETFFDEDTYQLTIYVKGYGRSKEYTIQFAEPDLSLNATWYGDKVEDGATINEAYNADKLVVTPGKGAKAKTSYNEETGVATITISSSKDSKTYTLNFAVIPAAIEGGEDGVEYTPLSSAKLNGEDAGDLDNMECIVTTLENGNINFCIDPDVDSLGVFTATNLTLAKDGTFSYAGNVRSSKNDKMYTVTMAGVIKNLVNINNYELSSAVVDLCLNSKQLYHMTYGVDAENTKSYTNDIVVTINGDATTIKDQNVTLTDLSNGNISFTLENFQMQVNGSKSYIGNIFLENLPIDADGNFTYDGGLLIGPGSDDGIGWGGLELGIVPLNLRGQRYNDGKDVIVVIDIDMQESIGQTIHVTMGAEAQSTVTYSDNMNIDIYSGEGSATTQASASVADTKVLVGKLKNGNINFNLTNFSMPINGATSYIGNVAIDNIALDSKGNFTYDGTIRIGKGTDDTKTWGGPDLGDVPVVIRGTVCDYDGGNSEDGTSQCAIALDVNMQNTTLKQTIHVTYGLETIDAKQKSYTDDLAVTVNGEKTSQEQTITVNTLRSGNINFSIDNFQLVQNGQTTNIGNIALENLILDSEGNFTYEGNLRIGEGSDESVTDWGGLELGDVPLSVYGQMTTIDGTDYLMFNIDIDMQESIQQIINVTFGATPVTTDIYTDDLKVTVNGDATTQNNVKISVGTLKNGYINFTLNNFAMQLNGSTSYIGNIAINALQLADDGSFSYNGNVRIGKGSDATVADSLWGGPDLGTVPLDMKGQIYTYNNQKYLLVSIAIDMQESLKQTIDVLFGGTPIRTVALNDNLKVTINEQENKQTADVTVGILRNGNINFTLRNFVLELKDGESTTTSNIGNLSIDNLEMDGAGNFTYSGNIRIGNGDDESVESWGGPDLGDIPVVLSGKFNEAQQKAHVTIDIDMQKSLSQIIAVEFGAVFNTVGDLAHTIKQALSGNATKAQVETIVNKLLGK